MQNKSTIFSRYNLARGLVRAGTLDAGRLNRALGVALSKEPRPYRTTSDSCTCEDAKYGHRHVCKHMLAKFLAETED